MEDCITERRTADGKGGIEVFIDRSGRILQHGTNCFTVLAMGLMAMVLGYAARKKGWHGVC